MSWKRKYPITFLVAGLIIIVGCGLRGNTGDMADRSHSHHSVGNDGKTFDALESDKYPVLFHLKTRNRFISVRCGTDGPMYTVKDHDGNILSDYVTELGLRAEFPKIHRIFEVGVAKGVAWAGL